MKQVMSMARKYVGYLFIGKKDSKINKLAKKKRKLVL